MQSSLPLPQRCLPTKPAFDAGWSHGREHDGVRRTGGRRRTGRAQRGTDNGGGRHAECCLVDAGQAAQRAAPKGIRNFAFQRGHLAAGVSRSAAAPRRRPYGAEIRDGSAGARQAGSPAASRARSRRHAGHRAGGCWSPAASSTSCPSVEGLADWLGPRRAAGLGHGFAVRDRVHRPAASSSFVDLRHVLLFRRLRPRPDALPERQLRARARRARAARRPARHRGRRVGSPPSWPRTARSPAYGWPTAGSWLARRSSCRCARTPARR